MNRMYVLAYVDDIIITRNSSSTISTFVSQLYSKFSLKDMGDLHYFLGAEVACLSDGFHHLCQRKYILDLLDRCHMLNAKCVYTLMVSSSFLTKTMGTQMANPSEYCSIVGTLQYMVLTRPDIAHAMNRICHFMHAPTDDHCMALKRILQYLCNTVDYGLVITPSERLSLVGYADAN